MCRRAPVSAAISTSRPTQIDSDCAGMPFSPRRNRLRPFAHDAACKKRRVLAVVDHRQAERIAIFHHLAHQPGGGDGLAVVADGNDPRIFHRGDFRERLALASDRSRADGPDAHAADAAARSTIPRVTEALSFTGCVLGMQQTAVKPPRAAERVPVSIVSDISWPGSRRWQWRSMKPGATISPLASKISAPSARRDSRRLSRCVRHRAARREPRRSWLPGRGRGHF